MCPEDETGKDVKWLRQKPDIEIESTGQSPASQAYLAESRRYT